MQPTFANVPYVPNGGDRQQLDIFLPANYKEREKLPVLVWIHGGSWQSGSKDDMKMILPLMPLFMGGKGNFVTQGYACVSINYRFISQAPFPAQIVDCKTAIRWLRANAKTYNLDPDRIGVWGVSAGGHLSAILGTSPHVKQFEVGENLNQSSAVQAVCDLFGPTDFTIVFDILENPPPEIAEFLEGRDIDGLARMALGGTVTEKRDLISQMSPIVHITKDCPPVLIVHGTDDKLVPVSQSTRFHEALKKAGVDVELVLIEGAGHDQTIITQSRGLFPKIGEFFDKHVKKETAK
jgi:acetyl esterase/lipase